MFAIHKSYVCAPGSLARFSVLILKDPGSTHNRIIYEFAASLMLPIKTHGTVLKRARAPAGRTEHMYIHRHTFRPKQRKAHNAALYIRVL